MKKISICLMFITLCGCANMMDKIKPADTQATNAAYYFSQGDYKMAQEKANYALIKNPNQVQALLVAALTAEGSASPNQAKAYYERIIILNPNDTTPLTTTDMKPVKVVDVAKKRLRALDIKTSEVIIEDYEGDKVFNIKKSSADMQNKSALEEALFIKEQKDVNYTKANAEANVKAVEVLFDDEEKNKISRFLILKELAEEDLITKKEFLSARMANIGAILPLTNKAPAYGLGKPVPSADAVLDRIEILKEGVEDQSISSKEFLAERNAIITALLPSKPRTRDIKEKPSRDILSAAKDLRKLEVLFELNLITKKEKENEAKAIEKFLGINQQVEPKPAAVMIEKQERKPLLMPEQKTTDAKPETNTDKKVEVINVETIVSPEKAPSVPEVLSPFEK